MFIPDRQVRCSDVLNSHRLSLLSFYQDDGFGNCIDTRKFCFQDDYYYDNVYDFVYDSFDFVG